MKILIIRNAFTYDFGGGERLAVWFAREVQKHGAAALVVSRQPRLLEYAAAEGVPAIRGWWWSKQNWSGPSLLLLPLYLVWQVVLTVWYIQLIIRHRIDVVQAMSKDDFIAATLAAKLLGRPVVWSDPADLKYVLANRKVWYKNPVGKLVFAVGKLADAIALVSHNEKRHIEESIGGPAPANYIVPYIGVTDYPIQAEVRPEADKDAVIFCSTSRLVVAKGIGELVEAFGKLSAKSDAYRLWIVGDGPDEALFKQQAGDNPYITFVGHSSHPLSYVAASDVFVHPSYHEGFSLSLVEAAMLGKPIVACDVGGNPELVNAGNGVLIPVRDPAALHEAMARLGEDKDLRLKLGTQARQDYSTNFNFEQIVAERYMPLYGQQAGKD